MADTMLTFRTPVRVQDGDGIWKQTGVQAREVYAEVSSVSRSEFFGGGQNGLKPEYRFKVFHEEYQGEDECLYNGEAYAIYRTHRPDDSDYLELYAERKAGVRRG